MEKRFDAWNTVKQKRQGIITPPRFREGQVWQMAVGENMGDEMSGKNINFKRPVLVLRKFNKMVFLGIPFTTKPTESIARYPKYYFDVEERNGQRSCLSLTQIRLFSAKRLLKQTGFFNTKKLNQVREATATIL